MDAYWKWLQDEVGEVRHAVSRIDITLASQHAVLTEHMRRTEALERRVDGMWLRVLSVVGGLLGIAAAAVHILEALH